MPVHVAECTGMLTFRILGLGKTIVILGGHHSMTGIQVLLFAHVHMTAGHYESRIEVLAELYSQDVML